MVAKLNTIDSSKLVLKAKYDTDKSDLEKKISDADKKTPDTTRLAKEKTVYKAKITDIENKIPSISGLATITAFASVKNKMPNVNNPAKEKTKTYCGGKRSDIKSKFVTTVDYHKFTKDIIANNIKSEGLVNKSTISEFINNADLDKKKKVATLAAKSELKAEQDKITKLEAFDSRYFHDKSHTEDDRTQNYLVFQLMRRYFEKVGSSQHILSWKSKGLSDESINTPCTCNNSFSPGLSYVGNKVRVKFDGSCIKQDEITFNNGTIMNIYIFYEINVWDRGYVDNSTLEKSLFVVVKLVKNANTDKYKYSGYGIGFERHGIFSVGNGFNKKLIIFRADMDSSVHVDNN